jgi:hypothetical protein
LINGNVNNGNPIGTRYPSTSVNLSNDAGAGVSARLALAANWSNRKGGLEMPELQQPPATGLALTASLLPWLEAAAAARLISTACGIGAHELTIKLRRVIDQGDKPNCVSCALAAAMETLKRDV